MPSSPAKINEVRIHDERIIKVYFSRLQGKKFKSQYIKACFVS
jgi:hypothetical protein